MKCLAGEHNLVFHADNMRIGGRDHIWVQDALTMLVTMFRQVVLEKILENKKALVCTPGSIWG